MSRGYRRRQTEAWRRTRMLVTLLVNLHRGPKDPAISAERLLPLPGDARPDNGDSTTLTPAQVEEMWAELDARDAALLCPGAPRMLSE